MRFSVRHGSKPTIFITVFKLVIELKKHKAHTSSVKNKKKERKEDVLLCSALLCRYLLALLQSLEQALAPGTTPELQPPGPQVPGAEGEVVAEGETEAS